MSNPFQDMRRNVKKLTRELLTELAAVPVVVNARSSLPYREAYIIPKARASRKKVGCLVPRGIHGNF